MQRNAADQQGWEAYYDEIRSLFIDKNASLIEVKKQMEQRFGFIASKTQYEVQFKKWKLRKNLNDADWKFAFHKIDKRKREEKNSNLFFNGVLVSEHKIKKARYRHSPTTVQQIEAISAPSPKALEGVAVCTLKVIDSETFCSRMSLPFMISMQSIPSIQLGTFLFRTYLTDFGFTAQSPNRHGYSMNKDTTFPDFRSSLQASISVAAHSIRMNMDQINASSPAIAMIPFLWNTLSQISNENSSFDKCEKFLAWARRNKFMSVLKIVLVIKTPIVEIFRKRAFFAAATLGEVDIVALALDAGIDINLRAPYGSISRGSTALQIAVHFKRLTVVKKLLECGADVDLRLQAYGNNGSPLTLAFKSGNLEICHLLLDKGAKIDDDALYQVITGLRPQAAEATNLVKLLLARGADPRMKYHYKNPLHPQLRADDDDVSILSFACKMGNLEICRLLLDKGATIDAGVLHWAIASQTSQAANRTNLVKLLLARGAHPRMKCKGHKTPLCGQDPWINCKGHKTPLCEAVKANLSEIAELLLSKEEEMGVRVKAERNVALKSALRNGSRKIVRVLLNRGADINAYSFDQYLEKSNPIQDAAANSTLDMIQWLIEAGADVNAPAYHTHGSTALQLAAGREDGLEIVRLLIDVGADVNGLPAEIGGCSALQAASQTGRLDVVEYLVRAGACFGDNISSTAALEDAIMWDHLPVFTFLVNEFGGLGLQEHKSMNTNSMDEEDLISSHEDEDHYDLVYDSDDDLFERYPPTTLLQKAAAGGNVEVVQVIMEANSGFTESNKVGALQIAARLGCTAIVLLLLNTGTPVNALGMYGTALTAATLATRDKLQLAESEKAETYLYEMLLHYGANVNTPMRTGTGRTPLHKVLMGHPSNATPEIVNMLLKAGADVNLPDVYGNTALQFALGMCHPLKTIALLLHSGANVNTEPSSLHLNDRQIAFRDDAFTPLQRAGGIARNCDGEERTERTEIVKLLLSAEADINSSATYLFGRTVLQVVCDTPKMYTDTTLLKILLDAGANVNAPPAATGGATALQFAAMHGHLDIIRILLEHGADINAHKSLCGEGTALEGAAKHGRLDIVHLLLQLGASTDCRAIELASREGHTEIVKLIEEWKILETTHASEEAFELSESSFHLNDTFSRAHLLSMMLGSQCQTLS